MQATPIENRIVAVSSLSNREFLERHAQAGRVGLSSGITLVDAAICRAERHQDKRERWGMRSHAFLFEGLRPDGCHWVIESGLQIHWKHIQLSVQENRIEKYFDEKLYTTPEDISRTPVPHVTWLRQGAVPQSNLDELKQRLRRCVGARLRNLKRRIANH